MGVGLAGSSRVPTKAALFQARQRLGPEPLQALFDKTVLPLAESAGGGWFYRLWRLMSVDGLCLDVADAEANIVGRPASSQILVIVRRSGCSGWPSADHMRSSTPR